ncbi:MAG: hypothetical protein ACK5RG_03990 [Cyclobacteriaceae bacterium]|jgi:hypothetical protein|nr:hypothetical protein [Flammeovirgaceae bacterium]
MENEREENLTPQPKKSFSLKPEMIIALSAVFVSVATLFVYIYQARIMQGQQHASVWPHIERQYVQTSTDGFILRVVNKGVGPAIIQSAKMRWNNEPVETPYHLLSKFVNPDSISLYYSSLEKMVLAPGEKVEVFHIYVKDQAEYNKLQKALKDFYPKFSYEICYCSIYKECWLYGREEDLIPCE